MDSANVKSLGSINIEIKITAKIKYFIVDHKLRKESSKEALFVKKLLKQNKIQANILTHKGKKPLSNVQSQAREIRYNLISKECVKNKLRYLLTAHHEDDQVENFFIRLTRGSGLLGLFKSRKRPESETPFFRV